MENQFITASGYGGGIGPSTTHLSYKKVDLISDRHDEGIRPSQSHSRAFHLVSYWIRYFPVESAEVSSFVVASNYGKVVLFLVPPIV